MPAFLTLMGEKSWYIPRWLDRLLPNVTIEPPHDSKTPITSEEFVHRPTPRERPPELLSDSERMPATASDVARAAVVIVGSKEYRP